MKLQINSEFSDILFQLRRDTGQSINTLIYKAIEDMNNNYKQERAHDGPTKQPDNPGKENSTR